MAIVRSGSENIYNKWIDVSVEQDFRMNLMISTFVLLGLLFYVDLAKKENYCASNL